MDVMLTTAEFCQLVGINYRRWLYLRKQFGPAFPAPARKIGQYFLWSRASVDEVIEINKDIPKYRKAERARG